jgi:hypothetical protein
VYNLTSGGSIEEWDGQALPSIDDATGGQVLALKSDKSALEFATVGDMTKAVYDTDGSGKVDDSTLWDGQALPSINSATGGQVLALKSDKSALEFATVSGGGMDPIVASLIFG